MTKKSGDDDAAALAMLAKAPAHPWPAWVRGEDMPLGNWVAGFVGHERAWCVSASLRALRLIVPRFPPEDGEDAVTTQASVERRVGVVQRWFADRREESQAAAIGAFDDTRLTHAWSSPAMMKRVDAWIDEAADYAVHAVWSGALPGPPEPPRPHICAGLVAICAQRALANDGVRGRESTLLVARAIAEHLFNARSVVPARSDGTKLYLQEHPSGVETPYDWAGPAGAHYAITETHDSTHVYAIKLEWTAVVYDAAGNLLGQCVREHWM